MNRYMWRVTTKHANGFGDVRYFHSASGASSRKKTVLEQFASNVEPGDEHLYPAQTCVVERSLPVVFA